MKYSSGREKLSVSWGEKGQLGLRAQPWSRPPRRHTARTVPVELREGPEEPGRQACCTGMFWLLGSLRGEGCDRHRRPRLEHV